MLYDLPSWLLLLVAMIVSIVLATGLLLLVRRVIAPERLEGNNEVAGFLFAVIGVIYAVLLAFVVITVWESFDHKRDLAEAEASDLVAMYHSAEYVPAGAAIADAVKHYTELIVSDDWPAMRQGDLSATARDALAQALDAIAASEPSTESERAWYQSIVDDANQLWLGRAQRLAGAASSMPSVLWATLLLGGIVTVAYSALYGVRNKWGHIAMTAALAGIVGLTLSVVYVLDYPYRGDTGVSPEAFELVLARMQH